MASKIYDIAASKARVAQVETRVVAQRAYILTLPLDERESAQRNLESFEDMLGIAVKTDLLIAEVVLARANAEAINPPL